MTAKREGACTVVDRVKVGNTNIVFVGLYLSSFFSVAKLCAHSVPGPAPLATLATLASRACRLCRVSGFGHRVA